MRPDSDTYFMKIALVTAERSTCLRHHVGTVVVIDKHILSGGYNGAPASFGENAEKCVCDFLKLREYGFKFFYMPEG